MNTIAISQNNCRLKVAIHARDICMPAQVCSHSLAAQVAPSNYLKKLFHSHDDDDDVLLADSGHGGQSQ
ncbi:unnamed protein product, partial [Brenthis ino]